MIRPDGSLRISGEAFAIERLRENPDLDYAELQRAAHQAGVTIQPIQFGRARRQLGLTGTTHGDGATARPAQQAANAATTDAAATEERSMDEGATEEGAMDAVSLPAASPAQPAAPQSAAPQSASQPAAPAAEATAPAKPRGAKPTTAGKSSPAFEFLMQALRDDPTVSYGELKAQADREDFKIAPIMYGRAKALLGLVPVRARGSGKRSKAADDKPSARTSRDGREPNSRGNQSTTGATDQSGSDASTRRKPTAARTGEAESMNRLEDLVGLIQRLEDERRRLRTVLIQIANTIDSALEPND